MNNEAILITEIAIALIVAAASIVAYFRRNLGKETIRLLNENNRALNQKVELLREADKQKSQQIAHLTGQVDVLKTVPLKNIDKTLATMGEALKMLTTYMKTHEESVNQSTEAIIRRIDERLGEAAT